MHIIFFQINVVPTAGAVYDAPRESAEQAGNHQRWRGAARGAVADAGAAAAHEAGPAAGVQHSRGHHGAL